MNPSSHNSKPPATDRHHPDDVDDPGIQKTVSQGDGVSSDLPETRHFAGKLRVGDRLASRYEILDQLGRGGFGAVYRAQDHELNRQVAVKRVNGLRSFVSGHIRGEARAIASLNHPNIISIYDLITVSSREMLIVMECPDGITLADHLTKARVPVVEAVDIALQVAVALQHAHSRQLVHSDLKPANLLIATDGRVRLLDFGLAVACFPDADKGRLTGGTPGYMSPEQIRGESHLIDGRVDIWALGVVLYQLLTGCRPFTGADARATYNSTLRDSRHRFDSCVRKSITNCSVSCSGALKSE